MTARVTTSVSSIATPQPAPPTPTGSLFVVGRADEGPLTVQEITGMAAFRETYGDRVTNNASLFDTCRLFFSEGGSKAYVVRAHGPAGTEQSDDYANVVWADMLDLFGADKGVGVVAVAGLRYDVVGEDIAAHCVATNRLGLVTTAAATDAAAAETAAGVIAGYTGADHLVYVWPHVTMPTATGTVTAEATGFFAGCRARAHALYGVWQSPLYRPCGTAQYISGPEIETGDSAWTDLNDANVSVVRTVGGVPRLYGWKTAASVSGDTDGILDGAQFRDLTNYVAATCNTIAEGFVGATVDGRGIKTGEFEGAIVGILAPLAQAGALFARTDSAGAILDPGYVVDTGPSVNSPASLAAGILKAEVGIRLSPTAEFVQINITAADAAAGL